MKDTAPGLRGFYREGADMATKAMGFFRKHQKKFMVALTIVAMLIFIVGDPFSSAGRGGQGGGIISSIKNFFGGTKENTVFRVASTNYDEDKLKQLQMQRAFAQDVVRTVAGDGSRKFLESLGFKEEDFRDQTKAQQFQQKLMEMRSKDPSIAEAQSTAENALLNQIQPSISLFGASEPHDSIAEYLHMKAKANSLGITVTNAMIRDDLLKLGMGKVSLDDINNLVRNTARMRGQLDMAKLDSVLSVLADEVRVSIAKQIAGEDYSRYVGELYSRQPLQGRTRSPQVTPADLWANYLLVKSSLNVGVLPLKVEDFISRIPDPTVEEKKAFFDKYKKDYPDPSKDTPGFKIPPLYRIGLMFADMKPGAATLKYYQNLVEGYDKIAPLNAIAELARAYELKKDTYRSLQPFIEFATTKNVNGPWLRVYSWNSQQNQSQLVNILANFAMAATQVGTFNPANAFAMSLTGEPVSPRQNEAMNVVQGIAGATSLAGLLQPALTVRSGMQENYTPFNVVLPALIEQRLETKSKAYLANDLDEIKKNLENYAKKYNEWRSKVLRKLAAPTTPPYYNDETKQTLQDYLTKFANARGLSFYETKDLRSKNDLLVEPNEQVLNQFVRPLYVNNAERMSKRAFEDALRSILVKDEVRGEKPKLFETVNSSAYDNANKNKEIVLHWVAEATEPRIPDFKDAEAAVTRAWKLEKARADVEQEAEKIVKEVKAGPDNYRKLLDMKGYVPNQVISRYSEPEIKSMTDTPTYVSSPVPKVFDNEPADFISQAFEKLKKTGDAFVVPDKSKTTYYVVYLDKRSEPKTNNPLDLEAFHNEVVRPSMLKQMTVDGTPFRNFVAAGKKNNEMKNWLDYLKGATGMNTELLKKNNDRSQQ